MIHGSRSTYIHEDCRCDLCRAANTAYAKQMRADRRRRIEADPTLRPHGDAYTYTNWGCRCQPCRLAQNDRIRQQDQARRALLPQRIRLTALERFLAKVDPLDPPSTPGDCWRWMGHRGRSDYPRFTVDGRSWLAHRWIYIQRVGPIPEGLELDHLCRHPWCVNPDHLEPVTHQENMRRAVEARRREASERQVAS